MADWRLAGARIAVERARYWPTRKSFAKATGLSRRVLDDLETGSRAQYTPHTLAAVEVALCWEPGTCERLAEGLPPRYELGPQLRHIHDVWPNLTDEHRKAVAQLADSLAAR